MKKILLLVATYVSILPHLTAQNVGELSLSNRLTTLKLMASINGLLESETP
jgi:hypothetical protein